jgi:alanine-synthesizing transaminase
MFSTRTAWNLAHNRYTEALDVSSRSGRKILDLTASNPTVIGLQYDEDQLLAALSNRESLTYQPTPKGMLSARKAVAAYYTEKGSEISADDLVLTTSTSEAYSFVFRLLCDPGDAVLVPVPSYPLFDFLADLNDVKLIPYELVYDDGWQIDFHSIRQALDRAESQGIRCRALLTLHPNNPTGSYIQPHEATELSAICAASDMALIVDEVFLDYVVSQNPYPSFSANPSALTFTLSGLSKISALPQMKVSWVAVSGPPVAKAEALGRLEVIVDTYLSMNAPVQLAVPQMLGQASSIQRQLVARIRTNLDSLDATLRAQNLCHRLRVDGGWYGMLRVPVLGPDEDLAIDILRHTGVLLQPGHFYNVPAEGHLVVSLITPSDDFKLGIQRALAFIVGR